jgi:tetratricopeptide (TPR) repeat protein
VIDGGGFLQDILLELELSRSGLLLLVDGARVERLRELVRALLPAYPDLEVYSDVRCVETVPRGTTLVLSPGPLDADWLNLQRPVFARKELRVILWCSAETSAVLAREAVDFFDWISHRHECPGGPAAHAVAGLRSALAARAPGVVWTGGDLEEAFREALPGRALRRLSAALPYEELVAAVQGAGKAWLAWTDVDGPFRLRRVRWAMAEVGRRGRAILVEPAAPSPGWWRLHERSLSLREARSRLIEAGARAPGRLAALSGFEPEAVALVAALLEGGVDETAIERATSGVGDPGAALAEMARDRGLVSLEDVAADRASPPALRALWRDPVVETLRFGRWILVNQWMAHSMRASHEEAAWWAARSRRTGCGFNKSVSAATARLTVAERFDSLIRDSATAMHGSTLMGNHTIEVVLRCKPESLTDWANLAGAAFSAGEADAASRWLSRVLALDPDHPASLLVQSRFLEVQGRLSEAEALLRRALDEEARRGRAGEEVLYHLAWNLASQGRYVEAEPLLRERVELAEKTYGPSHPLMGAALQGLAMMLRRQGRWAEAEALLRRALDIHEVIPRSESGLSAALTHDLAQVVADQGRYPEAEAMFVRALGVRQELAGPDDPSCGETMGALAGVLAAQGKLVSAEELLRQALSLSERAFGATHPATAAAERDLADVLRAEGRFDEAEALLRDALRVQERRLGAAHRALCATLGSLADLLRATGRRPEALVHGRRALELATSARLVDEPRLRDLVDDLSRSLS